MFALDLFVDFAKVTLASVASGVMIYIGVMLFYKILENHKKKK